MREETWQRGGNPGVTGFFLPFTGRLCPEPGSSAAFRKVCSLGQLVSSRPGGLGERALCRPEASPAAWVREV